MEAVTIMTAELFDNILQITCTAICTVWCGAVSINKKSQALSLLACFYLLYSMALLYWTLYLHIMNYTPKVFYVSDLSWVASFFFLLLAELSIRDRPQGREFSALPWAAPIVSAGFFIFFSQGGDIINNFMWCLAFAAVGYFAIEGLMRGSRRKRPFYIVVLLVVAAEYALWTVSSFWMGDSLSNPYFWIDFLISALLVMLLPCLKSGVEQ